MEIILAVLSLPIFVTLSESIIKFKWLEHSLTAKRNDRVYDA